MLFGEAKTRILRVNGDSGNDRLAAMAGDALLDAMRAWDTKHDWHFRLHLGISFNLATGVNSYSPAGLKRVYTARSLTPVERPLIYIPRRRLETEISLLQEPGDVTHYTLVPGLPDPTLYFYRTPSQAMTGLLNYHTYIPHPSEDSDVVEVPEEYLIPLLDMAKYLYLKDRSSETERIDRFRQDGAFGLADAIRRDRKHPDHLEGFSSVAATGRVQGVDPNNFDVD